MHIKFISLWAPLLTSVTASSDDEMLLLQLSSDQKKLSHPTAQKVSKRAVRQVKGSNPAEHRYHQQDDLGFVEDLARRVIRGETVIDDNTKEALSAMTSTLDQAHASIQSAHDADQALLNEIGTRANTCLNTYETSKAQDDAEISDVATVHTDLRECRELQATLDAAVVTACGDLEAFVQGTTVPTCSAPGVDGMSGFWHQHKTWYDSNFVLWEQYDKACTDAKAAAAGKVTECDTLQSSFESDTCTSRVTVLSTCATYVGCRDDASADYGAALTSTQSGELARKAEWEAVEQIRCYINVLVSDGSGQQKTDAVTACKELVTDTSHLTLVEPTVPDDQQCDLSSTNPYPCTDDFLTAKYDGLNNMKDCVACPALPAHLAEIAGTSVEKNADNCQEDTWPDRDHGLTCGLCKVLVNRYSSYYKTCNGYCEAIGRTCVDGWEESGDTCTVQSHIGCDHQMGSSDAICECSPKAPPASSTATGLCYYTTPTRALPGGASRVSSVADCISQAGNKKYMAFGCPSGNTFECWSGDTIQPGDDMILPDKECAGDVSESAINHNVCDANAAFTQEYNGKTFILGGWHREPVYELSKI